jgi:uncharacterized delta-60 repeat protein
MRRGLIIATVWVLVAAFPARADAGDLDTGFGLGGYANAGKGGTEGAVVQADGKIVLLGGHYRRDASFVWDVKRLLPNGLPDGSFGNDGAILLIGKLMAETGITLDASQRILISGNRGGGTRIFRLSADGILDKSFGNGGSVDIDLFGAQPHGLGVFGNGNIAQLGTFEMAVLGPDGALLRIVSLGFDPGYGGAGLVIQPDGKVVAAGGSSIGRFLADGSHDPAFNDGQNQQLPAPLVPNCLGLRPDGTIVVGGNDNADVPTVVEVGADGTWAALRYHHDPAPPDQSGHIVRRVISLPNGDVLLLLPGLYHVSYVAALTPEWQLDQGFAEGGLLQARLWATRRSGDRQHPADMDLDEGKLLLVGTRRHHWFHMVAARYLLT